MRRLLALLLCLCLLSGCAPAEQEAAVAPTPQLLLPTPAPTPTPAPEQTPLPLPESWLPPLSLGSLSEPETPETGWQYHRISGVWSALPDRDPMADALFTSNDDARSLGYSAQEIEGGVSYNGRTDWLWTKDQGSELLYATLRADASSMRISVDEGQLSPGPLSEDDYEFIREELRWSLMNLLSAGTDAEQLEMYFADLEEDDIPAFDDLNGAESLTLSFAQYVDGYRVYGNGLTATADGVAVESVFLQWDRFQRTSEERPEKVLSCSEALHSLNYCRASLSANDESFLARARSVKAARPALTNTFLAGDLFAPAWEFVLSLEDGETASVLVDMETGLVHTPDLGVLGTAFPYLPKPPSISWPDTPTRILERFLTTLWNGLYTMQAPEELPDGVRPTARNFFDLYWTDYRIELLRTQDTDERLLSPPSVSVVMHSVYGEDDRLLFSYTAYITFDRVEDPRGGLSFYGEAKFAWEDGCWQMLDAGCSWNGRTYTNIRSKLSYDIVGGTPEEARALVMGAIKSLQESGSPTA